MTELEKGGMTVKKAGSLGGKQTLALYGLDHFARAGKVGGNRIFAKIGREGFSAMGKLGGQVILQQRGREFFREIGKQGGKIISASRDPEYFRALAQKNHDRPKGQTDLSKWQETALYALLKVEENGSLRFKRILHASNYANQERLGLIADDKERRRKRVQWGGSFHQIAEIGINKLLQPHPDLSKTPRLAKFYQWVEESPYYCGRKLEEVGLIAMRKMPLD